MAQDNQYTNKAMKDHAATYGGFLAMMKWGTVLIALTLIALAVFLV